MKIIKLNATNSTNSFLKDLNENMPLENFTTVVTKKQLAGRGQRGNFWYSEPNKNLLFSTLLKFNKLSISAATYLNFTVSVAVFNALKDLHITNLAIKWPNDIMADNKKVCGILIENVTQNNKIKSSIVGIGLNVNQQKFPDNLPNAISLIQLLKEETNLQFLLELILSKLQLYSSLLNQQKFALLKEQYESFLYKKNIPTTFKDCKNNFFVGIIKGVSEVGKLQILLEDDTIKEFDIKEIVIA